MEYSFEKERMEALQAGSRARSSLQNALEALDKARGWGVWDMLGGGFISTMVKHHNMDKASDYIESAKADLKAFSRELRDIQEFENIDVSTGDFWGFADCFFDGLLTDWVMQDRINEARSQVQKAINRVDSIMRRIR